MQKFTRLVVLLLAFYLVGCSTEPSEGRAEGEESERGDQTAGPSDSQARPIAALNERLRALESVAGQALDSCMADSGFPQDREATALQVDGESEVFIDPLDFVPEYFGPIDEGQARSRGLLGEPDLNDSSNRPVVKTKDPEYFKTLDSCKSGAGSDLTALENLRNDVSDLSNRMSSDFAAATDSEVVELFTQLEGCLSDQGYPGIRLDEGPHRYMAELGIAPGEITNQNDLEELNSDPVGNEIVVLEPVETIYVPSEGEIALALVWVECAEETSYFGQLREVYDQERSPVIAKYETEILGLTEAVEETESLVLE